MEENKEINPPIIGEFSNWAGVISNELQTIIDFGFVQPTSESDQTVGVMTKRIILPPAVAKKLGEILVKSFENEKTDVTNKED